MGWEIEEILVEDISQTNKVLGQTGFCENMGVILDEIPSSRVYMELEVTNS